MKISMLIDVYRKLIDKGELNPHSLNMQMNKIFVGYIAETGDTSQRAMALKILKGQNYESSRSRKNY